MMNKIAAIKKNLCHMKSPQPFMEEYDEEELSPEDELREKIYKPYTDLSQGLLSIAKLINFARDQVDDSEFIDTICKKITRDLRSMADKFEVDCKKPE